MRISFTSDAWEDYLYWQEKDKKILKKINNLIKDIQRNPLNEHGIGQPERLKNDLQGFISRRINKEHRLIYKFNLFAFILLAYTC